MKPIFAILLVMFVCYACKNDSKKVKSNNIEVYYKEGISEEQARRTADLLAWIEQEGGGTTSPKSFQLEQKGDTVFFKMVVDEGKLKDIPDESFLTVGNIISDSIFKGNPVNVDLTNNKFKSTRVLPYKKIDYSDDGNETTFGEKILVGNIEVYATKGASREDAQRLAVFLDKDIDPQTIISFQLLKEKQGMYTVRLASKPDKMSTFTDDLLKNMSSEISDAVFAGAPIKFQVTDLNFNPVKTYTHNTVLKKTDSTNSDK